jgi:hypothetical protein
MAIGGYFELELQQGEHYHKKALRLNTARNCLEYVLRARQYKKIYIPYYTCEVILEPIQKLNIDYEFYSIDQKLEPIKEYKLSKDEAFLYTNYFGLKQNAVVSLSGCYGINLIVDNSQAFFADPIDRIDTFYSARKFFGVPDGAYLYTDTFFDEDFEQDISYERMEHLLKRIDIGTEAGYVDFQRNDDLLINQPIKKMSNLTEKILKSIDYDKVKRDRQQNYKYLHNHLKDKNSLSLICNEDDVPMVYPFLAEMSNLKQKLISEKIFVATYWPNVLEWCSEIEFEYILVKNIISLPIDQRWNECDMQQIIHVIENDEKL